MIRLPAVFRRALPALGLYAGIRLLGLAVLAVWAGAEGRSPHQLLSARWDSLWYSDIARHGYFWPGYVADPHARGAGAHSHLAFFPMLPWLERLLHAASGLSAPDAGLAVSAVASLAAALGIFTVGEHVAGTRAATLLVVVWAALPIGVLQSMAYTESLFTACAAWALWCVLREHWVAAGLLASAAGLTRPSGAAVVAAVWAGVALGRGGSRWLGAAIAPLGLAGYVLWVGARTGRGVAGYLRIQGDWGNGFDFGAAYGRFVWRQLTSSPGAGIGLLAFVALVLWAYAACLRQRQPVPLLVYAGVIVAMALGAQAYFNSKPRLLMPGFPLFLPLATWLATLRPRWATTFLATLSAASAAYGALWLLGPGPP